jgi:hypothetical protein
MVLIQIITFDYYTTFIAIMVMVIINGIRCNLSTIIAVVISISVNVFMLLYKTSAYFAKMIISDIIMQAFISTNRACTVIPCMCNSLAKLGFTLRANLLVL